MASIYNKKPKASYHKSSFDFQSIASSFDTSNITSEKELKIAINKLMKAIQEKTLEEMKSKLYEFIDEEVYSKHALGAEPQDSFYERTYDLLRDDIFEIERLYVKGDIIRGSIGINQRAVLTSKMAWQHSSPMKSDQKDSEGNYKAMFGDKLTVDAYVKIINNGVSAEHSIFGEIQPRPFWDEFLKWANENYARIFRENCRYAGIEGV